MRTIAWRLEESIVSKAKLICTVEEEELLVDPTPLFPPLLPPFEVEVAAVKELPVRTRQTTGGSVGTVGEDPASWPRSTRILCEEARRRS